MKKIDKNRSRDVDFVYRIFNPEDLLSRIYFALDNPNEFSGKRAEACKKFLYKTDGNASKRLIEAIENF